MSDPENTTDPVGEAQTDASQAQAEVDKALADPQADLNQLLDSLRTCETQLYGIQVVQQVQQLSDTEKQEFASARLHLTSVINQLSTAQLTQIESKLEQNDAALQQGIQSLQKSLGDLTAASSWASAINGVIGTIGQIIPLV
jgi:chromosome segregation ATPase